MMAGEPGFEPGPTESESAVLPLYYSPKAFQTQEVSRSLTSVIALFSLDDRSIKSAADLASGFCRLC